VLHDEGAQLLVCPPAVSQSVRSAVAYRGAVLDGEIAVDDPRAADVQALLRRHLAFAHAHTPAEHAYALDIDALLGHLIALARDRGMRRVSLETGTMAAFGPARALYASAGFTPCGPFGGYQPSPDNTFLTLRLA
jgi:putative acetyltransferase